MLKQIEQSLRRIGGIARHHTKVTAFDLFLSDDPAEHLSFAMPSLQLADWRVAIDELKQQFSAQQRHPRLEYLHDLYPTLQAALEQAGFISEMSAPIMVLEAGQLAQPLLGAQTHFLRSDRAEVQAFMRGQSLAFGGDGESPWLEPTLRGLAAGSVSGMWLEQDGQMVSGAIIQGNQDGELAGVWTDVAFRNRAFACGVCQRLLERYFQAGQNLCCLSPTEGAQSVYRRLGFRVVAKQLNMRLAVSP